ncbi:MAG: hypothetical protein LBP76_08840 [Treponema sp.]|jgi:hypothetical protein|nr:hypothetical protein [Treponema sp.]
MKHIQRVLIILSMLFPAFLGAMDMRIEGWAGNLHFDPESTAALGPDGKAFEPFFNVDGLIQLDGNYGEHFIYRVGLERDGILNNRIITAAGFDLNYVRLYLGPFAGIFNTEERLMNPGIAASFRFDIPGILFGAAAVASTLGGSLQSPGDYSQEMGEFSLGFQAPHIIITAGITDKRFSRQQDTAVLTRDELSRYNVQFEIFAKNVPYMVHINMGYQNLKRSYITQSIDMGAPPYLVNNTVTDELNSIYAGFEFIYQINSKIKVFAGIESPVYAWGEAPLKSPAKDTFIFKAGGGLAVSFGNE